MRTTSRLGQACILAFALVALGAARPEPALPQGEPASPELGMPKTASGVLPPGEADKLLPLGGAPIVKLIEAGAEPRADLSYTLVKGTTSKMVMAMDMSMAMKADGRSLPAMHMPRMSMGLTVSTSDSNDAGEFKIDSEISTVSVEASGEQQEQMANALRPQLEAMKGISMAYWTSAKGHVRDVKLTIPPATPAAAKQILGGMSQSLESIFLPLPPEPVGLGGKWQAITRIATNGADLLQSTLYTLKARDGNRVTLEIKIIQLAANDTIHNPQMPEGMSAKVKSLHSGASGTTRLDLANVAPEGGTMTLKSAMDISVQGPGAVAGSESTVETTTTMQITRP